MDLRDAVEGCPDTEHGLLVAYGAFAHHHGLIARLMAVPIPQKTRTHAPQTKVVELVVGLLAGIEHLRDLSDGSHPVVRDAAVARAWQQPAWAHASGVSRTLQACAPETVAAVQEALDAFSRPWLARAIEAELRRGTPLVFDADLTGQAVSSTSRTYPGAAFGWMNDGVRLGYQVARVCLQTHVDGRLWVAQTHHPGDTVSMACLRHLVVAAERAAGVRPRRRPDLVRTRLAALDAAIGPAEQRVARHRAQVSALAARLERLTVQCALAAQRLGLTDGPPWPARLEVAPVPIRPAATHQRVLARQHAGWTRQAQRAQAQLQRRHAVAATQAQRPQALVATRERVATWLAQLEADNATNPHAPACVLRIDAGFASGENLAWLIELGYVVYSKAPNAQTTAHLRARVAAAAWVRVGANAEVLAWDDERVHGCPYPLTVALERFHTGREARYGTLLYSGAADSRPTLAAWFACYNARQTIEAGNKESKGTFKLQHLMSRSAAGIALQVALTGFAANFVRWAVAWLRPRVIAGTRRFAVSLDSPKTLTRIAANSPAYVQETADGLWLQFTRRSSFPAVRLHLSGPAVYQPALPLHRPLTFSAQ